MDGKKRIARLRNAERWKRILNGFPLRAKSLKKKPKVKVHVSLFDFPKAEAMPKDRTWDHMNCQWIPRAKGTFGNGANFIRALKKRGYIELGRGAYSTVLAKDGYNRVIKVTRSSQDNWIDYIQWAARNGYCGNFAPRVYSWKKFTNNQTFSVAVIERMTMECRYDSKTDYSLVEGLVHPAVINDVTMAQVYLEDLLPGSVKFFKELVDTFQAHDIYGKNMMVRPDGSFCVTDPVCGRQATNTSRLRSKDFTSLAPAIWRFY